MRILLDTNVLVSAFVLSSPRMLDLIDAITLHHTLVLPSYVVEELRDVVREKFPQKERQTEAFLRNLPCELFETPASLDPAQYPGLRDPKDLPVLASAIAADVDVLLSGDAHFAPLDLRHPEVLTPRQFLEKHR
jgi:predicted nucleic acid-binding protein